MSGDRTSTEDRLAALERRITALEERLAGTVVVPAPPAGLERSETEASLFEGESIVSVVGLIGRTLIVLGGAFLIRFLTESGMLPQVAGTLVGIAYALFWVVLASRRARQAARGSATFDGVAVAMIGFPLLWETTVTFAYLTPLQSAAAVTVFTAIPLLLAWYRDLGGVALVVGAPAAVTMLALGFATQMLPPFVSALLLLAVGTLGLAYGRGWHLLAGIVAVVADFGVLVITVARLLGSDAGALASLTPNGLALMQAALVAGYLGPFSVRVFWQRYSLSGTALGQVVVVLLIGFGGFLGVAVADPGTRGVLGGACLVFAAACYAGAYGRLRHEAGRDRTFVVYSAAAATAVLVAAYLTLAGEALVIALALGALACSAVGSRARSVSLGVHGAVYVSVAALASGLAWGCVLILAGYEPVSTFWMRSAPWVVFWVSVVVMLLQPGSADVVFERRFRRARLPAMLFAAMTVGALVVWAVMVVRLEGGGSELTRSSILRTAVMSAAAVLLALLSRASAFAQAKWLVIPCLVAGGLKLVVQDISSGQPSILFGSLAIYGAALILAPRLMRKRG